MVGARRPGSIISETDDHMGFSYALEFTLNSTGSVGGNVFSTRGGQSRMDSSAPTGRLLKLNHSGVPDCILIAVIILLSNKMLLVLLPKV